MVEVAEVIVKIGEASVFESSKRETGAAVPIPTMPFEPRTNWFWLPVVKRVVVPEP